MTSKAMVDEDFALEATEAIEDVDAAGDAAGEMLMLTDEPNDSSCLSSLLEEIKKLSNDK